MPYSPPAKHPGDVVPSWALLLLVCGLGAGCVTTGTGPGSGTLATDVPTTRVKQRPDPGPERQREAEPGRPPDHPEVATRATALLGHQRVIIEGKRHRADCSGLVRGLYAESGHDLFALGALGKQRNGVAIIYRYVERYGRLHRGPPQKGELAFFDNSYDRNKDGRINDPLTHIGVVEKVRKDGTVVVIHHSSGSVKRLLVNTRYPDQRRNERGEPINDYLRRAKDGPRLSGELFVAWGKLPKAGTRRLLARK